jgi:hypothetical protein
LHAGGVPSYTNAPGRQAVGSLRTCKETDHEDKALHQLISSGHRLHVVYEAGPCGFVIWRQLNRQGIKIEPIGVAAA